jgi:hypothetical protein
MTQAERDCWPLVSGNNRQLGYLMNCKGCGKEIFVRRARINIDRRCRVCAVQNRTRLRPFESLYRHFISVCNRKESRRTTNLTYEDFLAFTCEKSCHYCEAPIIWKMWRNENSPRGTYNLDRKNNLLGYTKENVVVCCKRCNRVKSDILSYEDFLEVAEVLKKQDRKRNDIIRNGMD